MRRLHRRAALARAVVVAQTVFRVVLVELHLAVVEVQNHVQQDHDETENTVDVEGDRVQEHHERVLHATVFDLRHDGSRPRCQRNRDTHIGREGVDNIRKLGSRHLVHISHGTHDSTRCNGIKVII